MFRLRGSHCLSRTARHPELSNYLGVGKGNTAEPAVFFVLSPDEPNEPERLAHKYIHIGFDGLNGFWQLLHLAAPNIR